MKVPDAVYQDLLQRAQQPGQSAEELLRAAMELVRQHPSPRAGSVLSLKPLDLGKPLRLLNNGKR